ncbi:ATP-binding protein [Actinomadura parmotrematis]|uniref:Tetratricopeptide repeat protein n=1 Tax=Actinomadura parmotrematis TaxID=2864039 RepID=A0ABS7FTM5_9ACTN|nr:tetratricopeptide repeat protein [Actinomadura parmotrematis]MBW8483727.1 tetratricopeptide repeat protein [Actinomadura parmotrematis]
MDGAWRDGPWPEPSGRSESGLPAEASSFVGRSRELAELGRALERSRLVTLTGPGGVGKTRLALRAAHERAGLFSGGVRLVELSALRDGALLAETIAEAVGAPSPARVPARLGTGRCLLVLDTCEHLVGACAPLVRDLLRRCPALRVLVTSRQPLDLDGERVLPVRPLPVAARRDGDRGGDGGDGEAVALFAERAAEVVPGFAVTAANRDAVALLCRRLDGIPLAIELAAVRLRSIPLERLLNHLDILFWMLDNGPSELARHQTLRTTVGWSHELCAPLERLLWARLSVFAGGFDLAMAERVCADDRLGRVGVGTLLHGLVDKSIVQRTGPDRYVMLDTLREYGAAWLDAVEDARPLRVRHRDCMIDLAARAGAAWLTGGGLGWVRRLEAERDNLRAALEFCLGAAGEARTGMRLAVALWPVWACGSRFAEARLWLDRVLAAVPAPVPERAAALWQAAHVRTCQGDSPEALPLIAEALKLADRAGDRHGYGRAQRTLGAAATFMGDRDRAAAAFAEARRALEGGPRADLVLLHFLSGFHLARHGAPRRALAECDRALRLLEGVAGECWGRAWALYVRALAHWFLDEIDDCARTLRACVAMFRRVEDPVGLTSALELLGWVCARRRRYEEGAVLLGAASRYPDKVPVPRLGDPALEDLHTRLEAQALAALGRERYGEHHRRGRVLAVDEIVRFACDDLAGP